MKYDGVKFKDKYFNEYNIEQISEDIIKVVWEDDNKRFGYGLYDVTIAESLFEDGTWVIIENKSSNKTLVELAQEYEDALNKLKAIKKLIEEKMERD